METKGTHYFRPINLLVGSEVSESKISWSTRNDNIDQIKIFCTTCDKQLIPDTKIGEGDDVTCEFYVPALPTENITILKNQNITDFVIDGNKITLSYSPKGYSSCKLNIDTSKILTYLSITKGEDSVIVYHDDPLVALSQFLYKNFPRGSFKQVTVPRYDLFDTTSVETYWSPTFSNKVMFKKQQDIVGVLFKPMVIGDYSLKVKTEDSTIIFQTDFVVHSVHQWMSVNTIGITTQRGDVLVFEFTRPTGALYASSTEEYNCDTWVNLGASIGTFWGESYTIVMGFVFSKCSNCYVDFSKDIKNTGITVDYNDNDTNSVVMFEYEEPDIISVQQYHGVALEPNDWDEATNGQEILKLSRGTIVTKQHLLVKATIDVTQYPGVTVTPEIRDLEVAIGGVSDSLTIM